MISCGHQRSQGQAWSAPTRVEGGGWGDQRMKEAAVLRLICVVFWTERRGRRTLVTLDQCLTSSPLLPLSVCLSACLSTSLVILPNLQPEELTTMRSGLTPGPSTHQQWRKWGMMDDMEMYKQMTEAVMFACKAVVTTLCLKMFWVGDYRLFLNSTESFCLDKTAALEARTYWPVVLHWEKAQHLWIYSCGSCFVSTRVMRRSRVGV